MNRNTCDVPSPEMLMLTAENDIDALQELALLSCVALIFIQEETQSIGEDQVNVIKSCEELVECLSITDDSVIVDLAFKHINAYIEAREKQKKYFCADSTKASQLTFH